MKKVESTYKKLSIKQLEDKGHNFKATATNARKDLIELLAYIQINKRWRENPMHKESTFWAYLLDVFNIRQGTFRRERTAFINYPEETKKYGVGVIARIQQECHVTKVPKVLKEIKAKEVELKKPIKRDQIDTIIQKYTPPKPQKAEAFPAPYWKDRALKAEAEVSELKKQVVDLKSQLERNRPFVEAVLAVQASIKNIPRVGA